MAQRQRAEFNNAKAITSVATYEEDVAHSHATATGEVTYVYATYVDKEELKKISTIHSFACWLR